MSLSQLPIKVHKILHWEYWPVYIVYAPISFLWIWYLIRFRRWNFFRYTNPAIPNGGLYGVSKQTIYDLLPPETYPKTVLIPKASPTDIEVLLRQNNFNFPIIAKPNLGYRGVMVQKVASAVELQHYANELQQDFLVQEIVTYPNEMGLFYVRMPHERKGKITGITLKIFLTITGDGVQTMAQLLAKDMRHAMQIDILGQLYDLSKVLALKESVCLVPFGNHNRGTKFLDGKHLITPKLQDTFDKILGKINGFYYGRLDIRYRSFEELENGQSFSIIELNGAMSEPTHIYDPQHSFWYGQKEIFKHHGYFGKIIHQNLKQL